MSTPEFPDLDDGRPPLPQTLDPAPTPPERPLDSDCCNSGCDPCVFDLYAAALDEYRRDLAAWNERQKLMLDKPA